MHCQSTSVRSVVVLCQRNWHTILFLIVSDSFVCFLLLFYFAEKEAGLYLGFSLLKRIKKALARNKTPINLHFEFFSLIYRKGSYTIHVHKLMG